MSREEIVRPLTIELRAAGMGILDARHDSVRNQIPPRFYGKHFAHEASAYHQTGDQWGNERLSRFFADGLLIYYIAYFSRIDLTDNHHLLSDDNSGLLSYSEMVRLFSMAAIFNFHDLDPNKFNTHGNLLFVSPTDIRQFFQKSVELVWMRNNISSILPFITTVISLVKRLTTSEPLLQLGADYQRAKVICEKLVDAEDFGDEFIEQNRKAEILQIAICRWVEFYVCQIQERLKTQDIEKIAPSSFSLKCPPHILLWLQDNKISTQKLTGSSISAPKRAVDNQQFPLSVQEMPQRQPVAHQAVHESLLNPQSQSQQGLSSKQEPLADNAADQSAKQSGSTQQPHIPAIAAPSDAASEHAAVGKFFDGYSLGLRSFWRNKKTESITLQMLIDHAAGKNKVPHRFMADEYTGADTRKRFETVFGVIFTEVSTLRADQRISYVLRKIQDTQLLKSDRFEPF